MIMKKNNINQDLLKMHHSEYKNHPDRLFSAEPTKKYKNAKSKINAIVKEAKKKGYTILPADFVDNKGRYGDYGKTIRGLVLFKEFENGKEIAYNPIWIDDLGMESKQFTYLPPKR